MDKWTALLFAALAVAFVGVVVGHRPEKAAAPASSATAEAARDAGLVGEPGRGSPNPSGVDAGLDSGLVGSPNPSGDDPGGDSPYATSDAGATLLSGTAPPALPAEAPKSVVFGVILVQYKGAQGAPANAPTREAALETAKQIAADAKTDFKAALTKGDKGTMENAGRMPRGMLEPAPEFVLFSLPKDGVSDPVDTPRGFWIVHRIE